MEGVNSQSINFSNASFPELEKSRINDLYHNIQNKDLWIASEDGLFILSEKGKLAVVEALDNEQIMSLHKDYNDNIWIGTYNGRVYQFKNGNFSLRLDILNSCTQTGKEFFISEIASDKKGNLWLVGQQGELLKYNIETSRIQFSKFKSVINSIFIDNENQKWIGTSEGLIKLNDKSEKVVLLEEAEIFKIEKREDKLYVLGIKNQNTFLKYFDLKKQEWNSIDLPKKLFKSKIRDLIFDNKGNIWFSGDYIAIYNKKKKWKVFKNDTDIPILSLSFDSQQNKIWVGTGGRGLSFGITNKPSESELIFQNEKVIFGKSIEISNLYFKIDNSSLSNIANEYLDSLVVFLADNKKLKVNIKGHTSAGEDSEKLKALSLARAKSVQSYLLKKGIDENRIKVKGYGATRLKDKLSPSNDLNKRVEIEFFKIE